MKDYIIVMILEVYQVKNVHHSDDFRSLSSKLDRDITPGAPLRIPKLGPSTNTTSHFPFNTHQIRRIEETEPKTDIVQTDQQADTMTAFDRMPYTIGSRDLTKSGEIQLSVLREAAKELSKHREDNGLDKMTAKGRDRDTLYNFFERLYRI